MKTKAIPDLTPKEIARFHGRVQQASSCWLWGGETQSQGYGLFTVWRDRGRRRVRVLAHRLAYFLATSTDPMGEVIRHDCDTPLCCNPAHLLSGSQADNIRDAVERGRLNTVGLVEWRALRDAAAAVRLVTGEKRCPCCETTKALDDFSRSRRNVDGHQYWCKGCLLDSQRERRKMRAANLSG